MYNNIRVARAIVRRLSIQIIYLDELSLIIEWNCKYNCVLTFVATLRLYRDMQLYRKIVIISYFISQQLSIAQVYSAYKLGFTALMQM